MVAFIKDGALRFWCVGDSDLFLWRNETLYALNLRQEFKNELALRALEQGLPVAEAYEDPQAGALAEYIGKETVQSDDTKIPFMSGTGGCIAALFRRRERYTDD